MPTEHFTWTAGSGQDLADWLAGWEHRVAGTAATSWQASSTTEDRYRLETRPEEAEDRSAVVRRLTERWHAVELRAVLGAEGVAFQVREDRSGPPKGPVVVGRAVTPRWARQWRETGGLRVAETVETPRQLSAWLAHVVDVVADADLPVPVEEDGPAYERPLRVGLGATDQRWLRLTVADDEHEWRATAGWRSPGRDLRGLPEIARVATRPLTGLADLARWLDDLGRPLTGAPTGFADGVADEPLPLGSRARLTVLDSRCADFRIVSPEAERRGAPVEARHSGWGGARCVAHHDAFVPHAATLLHPVVHEVLVADDATEIADWLARVERATFGPPPHHPGPIVWSNSWPGKSGPVRIVGDAATMAERLVAFAPPVIAQVATIDSRLVEVEVATATRNDSLSAWPGGTRATFPGLRFVGDGLRAGPGR